jgi:hypothetical protein
MTAAWYEAVVHAWDMTNDEQKQICSLTQFRTCIAKAARNGVGMRTQSPFVSYYNAILRRYGRHSSIHCQLQQAVVDLLLSSSSRSSESEAQPLSQRPEQEPKEEQPQEEEEPSSPAPTKKLQRGMDRQLDDLFAPELVGLFPLLARINHACIDLPNAQIVSQMYVDHHVDVIALRTIQKGEEITISYLPPSVRSVSRRRQLLRARYLFDCYCAQCSGGGDVVVATQMGPE